MAGAPRMRIETRRSNRPHARWPEEKCLIASPVRRRDRRVPDNLRPPRCDGVIRATTGKRIVIRGTDVQTYSTTAIGSRTRFSVRKRRLIFYARRTGTVGQIGRNREQQSSEPNVGKRTVFRSNVSTLLNGRPVR